MSPRLTIVLPDRADAALAVSVLRSLSTAYQRDLSPGAYEVVVPSERPTDPEMPFLAARLGVPMRYVRMREQDGWLRSGVAASVGDAVLCVGDPGIASPTLVATLCAALDTSDDVSVGVRTFELEVPPERLPLRWLEEREWPTEGHRLVEEATTDVFGEPSHRWLDPDMHPRNLALRRAVAANLLASSPPGPLEPEHLALVPGTTAVQLIGDAFVRPRGAAARAVSDPEVVDPRLRFFGRIASSGQVSVTRPLTFLRRERPKLSVVVVVHEMRREALRTLASLLPGWQSGLSEEDYEIIVVDNGSTSPLSQEEIREVAPRASYYVLESPPPSPAYAINYGVARSGGGALAIMVDGACMLSPGALAEGLLAFRVLPRPIVLTRYFYLGPGAQGDTMLRGYTRAEEDRLLGTIGWPHGDGYRLFEISSPDAPYGKPEISWFSGWFESNCLFLPREVFDELDGYDERFDFPGGGFLNLDILMRALALEGTQPVQLIGEGVFHQLHGGITTNVGPEEHARQMAAYLEQYEVLAGPFPRRHPKSLWFMGVLASRACRGRMLG